MAFRRRLTRAEAVPSREDSYKHALRGHAMFVRFMDKWQLSDCIRYFSEDMTLGRLRQLTCHDLLMTYRVHDAHDRERIVKAVEEARINDSSDTEVRMFTCPQKSVYFFM